MGLSEQTTRVGPGSFWRVETLSYLLPLLKSHPPTAEGEGADLSPHTAA